MPTDYRKRFIFDDLAIRGELCFIDDAMQAILEKHAYSENIEQLLAELSTATVLLGSVLKYEGLVTVQMQGPDQLRLLMAECTDKGEIRAVARYDEALESTSVSLKELMPQGRCAFTLIPDRGQRYQGIIELAQDTIAENLAAYFAQSEQLKTTLYLFYENKKAFGLLLQQLPSSETDDEDAWGRVNQLAASLTQEEALSLDAETLLHRLYHEETVRHFEPKPVTFKCACSKERFARALLSLTKEDVYELLEGQEAIVSHCEFCLTEYAFDKVDVEQAFSQSASSPSTNTLQ